MMNQLDVTADWQEVPMWSVFGVDSARNMAWCLRCCVCCDAVVLPVVPPHVKCMINKHARLFCLRIMLHPLAHPTQPNQPYKPSTAPKRQQTTQPTNHAPFVISSLCWQMPDSRRGSGHQGSRAAVFRGVEHCGNLNKNEK